MNPKGGVFGSYTLTGAIVIIGYTSAQFFGFIWSPRITYKWLTTVGEKGVAGVRGGSEVVCLGLQSNPTIAFNTYFEKGGRQGALHIRHTSPFCSPFVVFKVHGSARAFGASGLGLMIALGS